jgi:hypothetical protein
MVLYIGVVPSPHVRILYKVLPEASIKPSHCEFVPRLALILSQSSGQACLRVCRVEESDQVKLWPTASAMALQPSWQPLKIADAQHNMQLSLQQTQLPSSAGQQIPLLCSHLSLMRCQSSHGPSSDPHRKAMEHRCRLAALQQS